LIAFILAGKYLEHHAKGKTSEAIKKLMQLRARKAILLTLSEDGKSIRFETEIDIDNIQKGYILKVTSFVFTGTLSILISVLAPRIFVSVLLSVFLSKF
jgi:hypothetical protein